MTQLTKILVRYIGVYMIFEARRQD